MKCTRCGKEMTIKPVQSGTDEGGEPVFTRYAFCYDCKIKVNLDKKKERDTQKKVTAEDVVETKTKKKKKRGKKLPSVSLPKRRGGGLLKFLLFLIVVAVLGFAAYTYRHPIAKFAQQMHDKYMNQTEENQPEDSKNNDLNMDSGNNNTTPDADTSDEPQNQTEPTDQTQGENGNGNNTPENSDDKTQDTPATPSDGTVTEP
ncbi:hypothetical protein ACTQXY_12895 [Faecalimonas sp. LCP19S3_D12]